MRARRWILMALVLATPAGAAAASATRKACLQSCAGAKVDCVAAARRTFDAAKAACAALTTKPDRRGCTRLAHRTFAGSNRACGERRTAACAPCCRTDGADCTTRCGHDKLPFAEQCNGRDDDCDGVADDGDPGGGARCGTTDVGACAFGTLHCVGGALTCVGAVEPTAEICGDGIDQDCDGADLPCAAGTVLAITAPTPFAVVNRSPLTVSGTVSTGVATVTCNGVTATLASGGFQAAVPLREGRNTLTCVGRLGTGQIGTASVPVVLDVSPPVVVIESPAAGLVTADASIIVTGSVNDAIGGSIGGNDVRVTCNGRNAAVRNGSFVVQGLALVHGPNRIACTGTDFAGNRGASAPVDVVRQDLAGQRLERVSPDGPVGQAGTELTAPLVVRLLDVAGNSAAGRRATFRVSRGSGTLRGAAGAGLRELDVVADADGLAQAFFTLGARTGVGNNRVIASALGFSGQVEFCAAALPTEPREVIPTFGGNQRGAVGQPLPLPFEVLVVDAGGNPVSGVPVVFTVDAGGGSFGGQPSVDSVTSDDGRAVAILTLGPDPGLNNNAATVAVPGPGAPSVAFLASGVTAGRAADTILAGVVLDDAEAPVPGATVAVVDAGLETRTDAAGRFLLTGAPVGRVVLHVDGGTSDRPERFPAIDYDLVTVAGVENGVGTPILLPSVDVAGAQTCGGDDACILHMANMPGVTLEVAPHSVTFPDGSHTGRIAFTQVHLDKVPKPPPDGGVFAPAWTVQPTGTRFDPPARLTLPNTTGLPPGQQIELFQFDHDLEAFVSAGLATVSADGATIASDAGAGITKAGWGGPATPSPTTCVDGCGQCRVCSNGQCVPDLTAVTCDDGNACTLGDTCSAGICTFGSELPAPCCGNTEVEAGEECDEGSANSDTRPNACRTNCSRPFCGDGVVDSESVSGPEECDDGEANNTGAPNRCRPNCTRPFCGDAIVDDAPPFGEECDQGNDNSFTKNSCRPGCKKPVCGDGLVDDLFGEECDDGNTTAGDGCSPACRREVCGNGIVDVGEACDDGNTVDDASCTADCSRIPTCGDGILDGFLNEACDNGAANSDTAPNACRTNCQPARCGDGTLDTGEGCDDGGTTPGDGCDAACQPEPGYVPGCGNGVVDPGEQCDDGPANSDTTPNACRTTCLRAHCGDGVVDSGPPNGETCDDGNTVDGDACPANCGNALLLEPHLIAGLGLCTALDRDILVTDVATGQVVTTDPSVTYEFIGTGLDRALLDALWNAFKARAQLPLPNDPPIATISVVNGKVVFGSPGVNILRARRGQATSNFAFVVGGGLQLAATKSLELQPESILNTPLNVAQAAINELVENPPGFDFRNAPLVLFRGQLCTSLLGGITPGDTGFVGVKSLVFQLFGGLVADVDLMQVLADLVDLIPEDTPVRWIAKAVSLGAPVAVAQLLEFSVNSGNGTTPAEDAVIHVTPNFSLTTPPFLAGVVQAKAPGLSVVEGKFKMDCVGEAKDDLLVFVAPELRAVDIRNEAGLVEDPLVFSGVGATRTPHADALFNLLSATPQIEVQSDPLVPGQAGEVLNNLIPGGVSVTVPFELPPGAAVDPVTTMRVDGDFLLRFDFTSTIAGNGTITVNFTDADVQVPLFNFATTWTSHPQQIVDFVDVPANPLGVQRTLRCIRSGASAAPPTPPSTPGAIQVDACFPLLTPKTVTDENGVVCGPTTTTVTTSTSSTTSTTATTTTSSTATTATSSTVTTVSSTVQTTATTATSSSVTSSTLGGGTSTTSSTVTATSVTTSSTAPGATTSSTVQGGATSTTSSTVPGATTSTSPTTTPTTLATTTSTNVTTSSTTTSTSTSTSTSSTAPGATSTTETSTTTSTSTSSTTTSTLPPPDPNELCFNEVVTDPKSDWSDSVAAPGGSGAPFDLKPGIGVPDTEDEYIEIRNSGARTVSLVGVLLRMTDSTPSAYILGSDPTKESYSPGDSASAFRPGGVLVLAHLPGDLEDSVYLELLRVQPGGFVLIADLEIGGNDAAHNFKADDDRDGRVDEDPVDGIDNDGDGLIDEDDVGNGTNGFSTDPIRNGAPGPGLDGASTGPGDEAIQRVANDRVNGEDVAATNFQKGSGTPGSAVGTTGNPVITEVVTHPESDWNDSSPAPGSGVPFDAVPGSGTIDADDQYVEIRNSFGLTTILRDAVLEYRNGNAPPVRYRIGSPSGGVVERYVPSTSSADFFQPNAVLVIGNPPGQMADDVTIRLILPCISTQTLVIGPGGAPSGPVTGTADESLRRKDFTGDDTKDFVRGPGDPGVPTP